jgi:hydrogenase maturation factor
MARNKARTFPRRWRLTVLMDLITNYTVERLDLFAAGVGTADDAARIDALDARFIATEDAYIAEPWLATTPWAGWL